MKVATIGFFDGVHKGHQFLLHQVMKEAERVGGIPACVTFDCPPRMVVERTKGRELSMQLLTTQAEKALLLHQIGIEDVKVLHFTPEIARMSAYDFMREVLKEQWDVGVLLIGYDHRFGHNREEGFEDYVRYGQELGIRVVQAQAYEEDYITVSSSLIRETLLQGRITDSRKLLGYNYFIEGVVVNGFKVGRKLGYPTANIEVPTEKLIPCDGVYVVQATVNGQGSLPLTAYGLQTTLRQAPFGKLRTSQGRTDNSQRSTLNSHLYNGMLNIGWRPTFNGNKRTIEVNLFNFDGNIYSEHITLHFIDFLRPERKFDSPEELVRQLAIDEQKAKKRLEVSG